MIVTAPRKCNTSFPHQTADHPEPLWIDKNLNTDSIYRTKDSKWLRLKRVDEVRASVTSMYLQISFSQWNHSFRNFELGAEPSGTHRWKESTTEKGEDDRRSESQEVHRQED